MEVIQKELGMAFDQKKREFLVAQLGEEEVARREGDTKAAATALAEAGVESKQANDPPADKGPGEGAPPVDGKEGDDATKAPLAAGVSAKEIGDAAAKAIMGSDFFKEMVATIDAVKALSEKNAEALKSVQATDDEKIASQFTARAAAARLGGHQASTSEKTIVGEDDDLAKVGQPKTEPIDGRFATSLG
jgi:hypothetical protein